MRDSVATSGVNREYGDAPNRTACHFQADSDTLSGKQTPQGFATRTSVKKTKNKPAQQAQQQPDLDTLLQFGEVSARQPTRKVTLEAQKATVNKNARSTEGLVKKRKRNPLPTQGKGKSNLVLSLD